MGSDDSFDLFWVKTTCGAEKKGVEPPKLRRKRKAPARFEDGVAAPEFHDEVKVYCQIHVEAADHIIATASTPKISKFIVIQSSCC